MLKNQIYISFKIARFLTFKRIPTQELFTFPVSLVGKLVYDMSENICLQWDDFRDNINTAFKSVSEDVDFADVTKHTCNESHGTSCSPLQPL